ncbi:hypothetical protein SAMN04488144_116101 [Methylobacterium sp. 190mf]|jgi:hypothetical protein|nr:hypothetical protein SAMN04488144_116101 [Methylobacterium sp. 190mf]
MQWPAIAAADSTRPSFTWKRLRIGWGLSGFCAGPAVAALSTGAAPFLVSVAAMLLGMATQELHAR